MLNLDRLLEERRKPDGNRLTQDELAALTGIPQSTLSKWIGNKIDRYDSKIIKRLCYVLKCDVSDLIIISNHSRANWDGRFEPYPNQDD